MPVQDRSTGETREVEIFVAVLGASNYSYAEVTWSQELRNWIMAHCRAFEFFGGVPAIIVPDNLRSSVSRPCRYEPDTNPTYHELCRLRNYADWSFSDRKGLPVGGPRSLGDTVRRGIITGFRGRR